MSTPLASEKIIRGILKTLVHQGVLATSVDTDALEAIPVNATDAQIDAVVAAFTPTVVPITGVSTPDLISNTDLTMWVDADSIPFLAPHYNYFRVAARGTTIANVDKTTEWASISRYHLANQPVEMVLGPLKSRLAATDTTGYSASLSIGSYYDAGDATKRYRGVMTGSATALSGNGFSAAGLGVWTSNSMELASNIYMGVVDSVTNAVRGGFYGLNTDGAALFVGAYPFATVDALLISKLPGAGVHDFQIRMNRSGQHETLYVNSAESTLYSACLAVNGNDSLVDPVPFSRKPTLYPGAGTVPTFSAFGTASGKNTVGLFSSPDADYTGGSVLRVLSGDDTNPNLYSLILAESWNGAAYVPMFRVKGDGNVLCAGAFTGGGADLAEWIPTSGPMEPGTVVVLCGGLGVISDRYRAPGVVGVVATQPGLVANGACADLDGYTLVSRSGMVPVKFSTEFGGVDGNGEMLCSGPDGHCVRAPQFPEPGTIVGKAMGTLHRAADGSITTGVIMAVVG